MNKRDVERLQVAIKACIESARKEDRAEIKALRTENRRLKRDLADMPQRRPVPRESTARLQIGTSKGEREARQGKDSNVAVRAHCRYMRKGG